MSTLFIHLGGDCFVGRAYPDPVSPAGRVSGYFISAREFEELQRLRAFERRVHRIGRRKSLMRPSARR